MCDVLIIFQFVFSEGNLVVVKWGTTWARGCVEVPDPIGESHLVRLLDHGGYWYFSTACMRQMCCNYISLPAQAIEVYLANVQPKGGKFCHRLIF